MWWRYVFFSSIITLFQFNSKVKQLVFRTERKTLLSSTVNFVSFNMKCNLTSYFFSFDLKLKYINLTALCHGSSCNLIDDREGKERGIESEGESRAMEFPCLCIGVSRNHEYGWTRELRMVEEENDIVFNFARDIAMIERMKESGIECSRETISKREKEREWERRMKKIESERISGDGGR